jgi:hypothetical protein
MVWIRERLDGSAGRDAERFELLEGEEKLVDPGPGVRSVGWPSRIPANGLCESIWAFVNKRSSSS